MVEFISIESHPTFGKTFCHTHVTTALSYSEQDNTKKHTTDIRAAKMGLNFNSRRKSSDSSLSASSSTDSLDHKFMEMTLPLAPREDNFNMSEKQRQQRMLSKCRKAVEPWKSAKPLPTQR